LLRTRVNLEQLDLNRIYYLFHRDSEKPSPHVNMAVKISTISREEISFTTASGDYFYGNDMQRYSILTFSKYFFNKNWFIK
jgi:hypothetical protein